MTAPREAPTLEDLIWVMNNVHESVLPGYSRNTIIASLERLRAIENARPENPCSCVPDGDDGTVAHLCHWHKQMLGKAYRMQNMANTLTVERIAKLPQDRLRLWIAHGIQESTARKRAEERLEAIENAKGMPEGPQDYPHCPAAFINVIHEEGTKAEAVKYLAQTWNELQAYRKYACALRLSHQHLQDRLNRMEAERDAAVKVRQDYDRWLSEGVYYTTEEYTKLAAERRAELDLAVSRAETAERQLAEAIADVEKLREEKRNMWERGIILENQLAELQRKHDGLVARLREPSVEMIEAGKKVFIDFPANGHLYQEIRLIHKAMSAALLAKVDG